VHAAFAASALTSVVLVISYIRIVVGWRFALVETGILQLVYLVLFSYTHFFKGYTGLIVTVFSILTLFAVMQVTARVRWSEVFGGRRVYEGQNLQASAPSSTPAA
jgi:inner membrane protein involved in colicin E2 resistance